MLRFECGIHSHRRGSTSLDPWPRFSNGDNRAIKKILLDQHMSRKKYASHQATVDKLAIINRIHERALEWREAAHLKSGDMLAQ
jgi:hypothetical protein